MISLRDKWIPRPNLSSQFVASRNEMEKAIAEIWQTILGVTPIGIHDNFFELGVTRCSRSS